MSYGSGQLSTNLTDPYPEIVHSAIYFGASQLRGGLGAVYVESGGNDYDGKAADTLPDLDDQLCGSKPLRSLFVDLGISCYETSFRPRFSVAHDHRGWSSECYEGTRASYSTTGPSLWYPLLAANEVMRFLLLEPKETPTNLALVL